MLFQGFFLIPRATPGTLASCLCRHSSLDKENTVCIYLNVDN